MDNNNIDFKDLWKKQAVSQPNMEDLMLRLKKFKRTNLRNLWITNILLFATSAFILFVWYYYQPQFVSSKLGIVLAIAAMAMYVLVYNRSLNDFKNSVSTNGGYYIGRYEARTTTPRTSADNALTQITEKPVLGEFEPNVEISPPLSIVALTPSPVHQ